VLPDFTFLIEVLGTISFAMSGSFAAMQKRFDHVGFLGDTLAKIAFEKAGIIKQNTPVVVGEWVPETRAVFEQKALKMNSPLFTPDVEMQFEAYENGKMLCKTSKGSHYVSVLTGMYQLRNLATLLKTIYCCSNSINYSFNTRQ
jgi:folylpolyglutamate synthase/dihydropteroate synthase